MFTGLKNATTYSKVQILLHRIMIEISSEQKKRLKGIAKLAHFGNFGVRKLKSEKRKF